MHDDNRLDARFRALAASDAAAAPELTFGHIDAWRTALRIHRRRALGTGAIVGMAAGAVLVLTAGLVLGASTGYASAEVIIKERGDTPLPPATGLAALTRIPPLMFSCASAPTARVAALPPAQQGVPIVDLPVPATKTAMTLGGVLGVRVLSDGNILVNDAGHRQMRLFDSTLALKEITLDSIAGTSNSYGPRAVSLTKFVGDSSIMGSYQAQTVLVLNGSGRVARALASIDDYMLTALALGNGTADDKGRVLYSTNRREDPMLGLERARIPDSSVLLRANLDTRQIDTVARLKSSGTMKLLGRVGDGPVRYFVEPVQLTDDWAVLSDGSIAIVRGHDYHVDWIAPDGSMRSSPKMPFDWKRISDEEKQRLIDSVRQQHSAGMRTRAPTPDAPQGPGRRVPSSEPAQGPRIPMEYIAPDLKDVFDFYPPIRRDALRADLDGNLWILPTTSAQSKAGELVYDVVNAKGNFHRVRVPLGHSIVGFGKGVVFLLSGDKTTGFYLEKTKLPAGK